MRLTLVDNVLLEQGATGFTVETQPHLGLISLIAVLRAAGHDATLYDPKLDLVRGATSLGPGFYRDTAERIVATNPDVVGFTSLGCNFVCTAKIAGYVRQMRPAVPILLGGPHASIVDREILERFAQFDVLVRNEAEGTIAEVVAAVAGSRAIDGIPGVTYRKHGAPERSEGATALMDVDQLPFGAYDAYPIAELGLQTLRVDAGRGCPFACTFCSTASYFGRRYRVKSAARLVDELDRLAATYGITHFGLTHDLFTVDKRKIREFCAVLAPRRYTWSCSARMDCVDDALLNDMRDAGCTDIYYGVETGSARLQPIVGKHLDLDLYRPRIETSLRLGIDTTVSFITGYPNETFEDQNATLNLAGSTIRDFPDHLSVQVHLLTPEPGTALHATYGDVLAYDGHISDFNFPTLEPDDAAIMSDDKAVFVCHQYYDAGLDRRNNIAVADGYRALYGLGHEFLTAMHTAYGGTFDAMVRDFGHFFRQRSSDPMEAVAAFLEERFGADDPLADILTYRAAVARLQPDDSERLVALEPTTPIRLARTVAPIGETRDGAELLRRLRAGESLTQPPLAAQHYLVVASADVSSRGSFAVDAVTHAMLRSLQSTTTTAELESCYGRAEVEPRLWSLCLMGTIVRGSNDAEARRDRDAPMVTVRR